MRDVTIIITTHLRPVSFKQCIKKVRQYYPDTPVIVVTDEKLTHAEVDKIRKNKARLIKVEKDAGLSVMRNKAIRASLTPYVMVMEEDMLFLPQTALERLKTVLEADSKVALAAGSLHYDEKKRNFINRLVINKKDKEYEILNIDKPDWKYTSGGIQYCFAEYTYNFFMMRKEAGLYWDDDLKVGIEHIDFFIRMKLNHPEWKAACVPEVEAKHKRNIPSFKYFADRRRKGYWELFNKKTGFAKGINLNSRVVNDYKRKRTIPYPEYVFFLLKNNKKVNPQDLKFNKGVHLGGQNG